MSSDPNPRISATRSLDIKSRAPDADPTRLKGANAWETSNIEASRALRRGPTHPVEGVFVVEIEGLGDEANADESLVGRSS